MEPSGLFDGPGGCDAIVFYVANWRWDIAMHTYFASIWVTDTAMSETIAQATYQTAGGPDKWINAREKVLELVDKRYESVGQQPRGAMQNTSTIIEKPALTSPPAPDGADSALALQNLKDL